MASPTIGSREANLSPKRKQEFNSFLDCGIFQKDLSVRISTFKIKNF